MSDARFGIACLSTRNNIRSARFGLAGVNCDSVIGAGEAAVGIAER